MDDGGLSCSSSSNLKSIRHDIRVMDKFCGVGFGVFSTPALLTNGVQYDILELWGEERRADPSHASCSPISAIESFIPVTSTRKFLS
jgi:hypothetical protein